MFGVVEQLAIICVATLTPYRSPHSSRPFRSRRQIAHEHGAGVLLVNRNELGPEAQSDDGHADRRFVRHERSSFEIGFWPVVIGPLGDQEENALHFSCGVPCRIVGGRSEGKHPERTP